MVVFYRLNSQPLEEESEAFQFYDALPARSGEALAYFDF